MNKDPNSIDRTFDEQQLECIILLCDKAAELGRIPVKSDFESAAIINIKRKFGPWPRALEAAGLKPVTKKREEKLKTSREKRRQRRIRLNKK